MKQVCHINNELTKEFDDLAKFLRIIGENNRLKILCLLNNKEYCVCELADHLDLQQNLISTHLKVLKSLNIVESRREWKNVYYSINRKIFKKYSLLLKIFSKNYEK